ncbi:phage tail length tape measure family protein [Sinorhizobium fredii]|uniref:phage tail length tape measure family protein n=1 Tax=Rhizobium fredii TaxID=380 RepID=UPI0004B709D3|nr:phage tail length tape measure family protein [Sinorhizobium fredii]
MTERRLRLVIDPSGAETGGRVVKRTLDDIGKTAVTAKTQIDQLTRAQQEMAKSAQASAASMFQQMDQLRARFNPTYAALQRYKQTQDEIRQAHRLGALSVNEMSAALSRERQAALSTIQAIKGHTAAVTADNAAMRAASFQRRNLVFQLNDVAVSLASGMNPLMVFAQQGSQISQIYAGQGGVAAALRETGEMAGQAASRFGRWGVVLAPLALGLANIKSEAESALRTSVTWGEVMTATFQTIAEGLQRTFGPAVATLLDPLLYAFDKLSSAAVDIAELIINSFRAAGADIGFVWDQLPNIVGGAFVGAVNVAVDHLNKLVNASKQAVNQIIDALNNIPGVDLSRLDASGQATSRVPNTFAVDLGMANREHAARQQATMSSHPLREFAGAAVDRIGTNRARSRLADFADMDLGSSIQAANALSQAVGGVGAAWQQAKSAVVDVNQQMADARRNTLAGFEQSGKQLRTMKTELKEIQATLAAAAQTPVADVFGTGMSGQAAGAIDAAASSIGKVFAALNDGRLTAQGAHEALELIRASLHQLGGDTASVDRFMDSMINANLRVGELQSGVKSLSAEIAGIPNRMVGIGYYEYSVGGGQKVGVYTSGGGYGSQQVMYPGGNADFSYQQYSVGGGKTVGVSGGNGIYGQQSGYYFDSPYDLGILQDMGYQISGARAAGGPVSAGGTYLVGENGPELLKMSGAGSVANTNATASILSSGRSTSADRRPSLQRRAGPPHPHKRFKGCREQRPGNDCLPEGAEIRLRFGLVFGRLVLFWRRVVFAGQLLGGVVRRRLQPSRSVFRLLLQCGPQLRRHGRRPI